MWIWSGLSPTECCHRQYICVRGWGVRERRMGVSARGNICFKATRAPCLCVWPCVSKVDWGSHPWTCRPWHKHEEGMLLHSRAASENEQHYSPTSQLRSLTPTIYFFVCARRKKLHHRHTSSCCAELHIFLPWASGKSTAAQSSG